MEVSKRERFRDNLWNILFFLLILILAIIILSLILSIHDEKEQVTKVGAIFIGEVNDNGWNENQYDGIIKACDEMAVPFEMCENVNETYEDCLDAVRHLNSRGCVMIFLTSAGFGNNVSKVARDFPDIMFYTISPDSEPSNMVSYFGRVYQMRYITGMIAAKMTKTGNLGFVAAKRDPQVFRSVNAYYLGAKAANPNIHLKVCFTNKWYDPKREKEAAEYLIHNEKCDVMAHHSSVSTAIEVADKEGIYSTGYNDLNVGYSDRYLTAVEIHWDILYNNIIRDYMRGTISDDYWMGVNDDVVGLAPYSKQIEVDLSDEINRAIDQYAEGWDVFMGQIKASDNTVKCRADERIGDESLLFNMRWTTLGVEEVAY